MHYGRNKPRTPAARTVTIRQGDQVSFDEEHSASTTGEAFRLAAHVFEATWGNRITETASTRKEARQSEERPTSAGGKRERPQCQSEQNRAPPWPLWALR